MKRLALLILLLAPAAFAAKLPIVEPYTFNGIPTAYDSVRRIVYNFNATTVLSNLVTAGGDSIYREELTVDSCGTYKVNLTFYGNSQRQMVAKEIVSNCYGGNIGVGVKAVRDSMDEAAQTGTLTLDQEDIDSISAAVVRGVNTAAGTGINTVTLYARDTVNNTFVSGVYITAVGGVDNLNASTGVNGYATFNCNTATYTFSALGSPFTWVPFTRTVAGNITDTINGGGVSTFASTSPDEATVYGSLIGGDGEVAANWDVRFTLEDVKANLADTATGQMVVIKVVETSTNGSGFFTKGLLKTENMLYKSGTQFKHPVWRMVASPSDVKTDPRIDFTFSIPSDSTTLDLGLLIKEGVN